MHRIRQLVCILVITVAFAPLALGHSASQSTRPADGARLDAPPERIHIRFDQPIRITLVRLTDASGQRHEVSYETGEATTRFEGSPPKLRSGSYTIEWRGLSADGHPASGKFSFRIE